MALETPSRPPPFMANAILNFHFDYLNPSLIHRITSSIASFDTKPIQFNANVLVLNNWNQAPLAFVITDAHISLGKNYFLERKAVKKLISTLAKSEICAKEWNSKSTRGKITFQQNWGKYILLHYKTIFAKKGLKSEAVFGAIYDIMWTMWPRVTLLTGK